MKVLSTTDEVIDALGGNGPVGAIVGVPAGTVSAWRQWYRGKFPTRTYKVLHDALAEKDLAAPDSLWPHMAGAARSRHQAVA